MDKDPASTTDALDDTLPQSESPGVTRWLSQVGLGERNPFLPLDAGDDPDLRRYLVRHDVFRTIWHDSPSVVFAPAGGGKSTFRVRLAYAARVGEDNRRVFVIPYLAPRPEVTSLKSHRTAILKNAAQELLLRLAARPEQFQGLDEAGKQHVRQILDRTAPGLLDHFLPQLDEAGSVAPLVEAFDPSAAYLLPSPDQEATVIARAVRSLCRGLGQLTPTRNDLTLEDSFHDLLDLLRNDLEFEAIYLLVDGVDAYPETIDEPWRAMEMLQPLLDRVDDWSDLGLFVKLFLPIELEQVLPQLTDRTNLAIIDWNPGALADILRARLHAASRGAFDSLDAISAPSLLDAEAQLTQAVPPVPRELLVLMNRVLVEHVERAGSEGTLELEDVEAAIDRYRAQPQSSSA